MSDTRELYDHIARIDEASDQVAIARRALDHDKTTRKTSWFRWLIDLFSTTDAEANLAAAEEALDAATAAGRAAARQWVMDVARRMLEADDAQLVQHQSLSSAFDKANARYLRVADWLRLVERADRKLREAADNCESASTMEVLDLVSTNKAFSAMSYVSTSDASDSVRDAKRALQDVIDALPNRADTPDIGEPDDLLDLVFDFSFSPSIDILSWLNMSALDDAASGCRRARDKLKGLHEKLLPLSGECSHKAEVLAKQLRAMEAPFLAAAAAQVPIPLRQEPPVGFD